ncbi:MAG: cyclodeaminase/cyclohydrolase family protein [Candidatus Thermoplasmatota archaeon]
MQKLSQLPINLFLDELASSSPAPGGGSVAALAGALGAALTSMVGNLTLGKEAYLTVQEEIQKILSHSEQLRKELTDLIDKDTAAFNEVITAIQMPKETDEQKQKRRNALQQAYKKAAQVPFQTAQLCEQILDLALEVAQKGNKNSITDAAVSSLMAHAGVQAAVFNVKINLGAIKDEAFVKNMMFGLKEIQLKSDEKNQKIINIVESTL